MRSSYWLLLVVASLGWGTGGIATRAALEEGVGPWTIVGARIPIAAVLVLAILVARRSAAPTRHDLRIGIVQSVVNLILPFVLMTLALQYASAGFVGILVALVPIGTSVLAHFVLPDEPLTRAKIIALVIAFTGVAALMLSGDSGLAGGGRPMIALLLVLTAVAAVSFAGTHAKYHAGTYDPTMLTGVQFALGMFVLAPAMFLIEGPPTDLSVIGWMWIVYMAIISTVIPFLIYFWLLQHVSATNASLVGYLVPFVGLFGGILLLDEQLQAGIVVAGLLVAIGLYLSDRQARRANTDPAPAEV